MKPPTQHLGAPHSADVAVHHERPPSIPWWPLVATATLLAGFAALAAWKLLQAGSPARETAVTHIAAWYGWVLAAPLVATVSYRLVARDARVRTLLCAHLGMLLAVASWHVLFVSIAVWSVRGPATVRWPEVAREVLGRDVETTGLMYVALAGAVHASLYRRRLATTRTRTREIECALVQARLLTLQRQLQPHFLFNALNAIAGLMYRDLHGAERALVTLGDLLRMTLERSSEQLVPLAAELDVVRAYLDIEQLRLEHPLAVRIDVEPGAEDALVPNLLLQPLVENAVRHGVSRRRGPGRIGIRARREGRHLRIEVQDDGPGLPRDSVAALHTGIGVSTTRARLQDLFAADFRFEFHRMAQGLAVLVAVPWQAEGDSFRSVAPHDEDAEMPHRGRRAAGA